LSIRKNRVITEEKNMFTTSVLRPFCQNKPAAVLGGGPSLPDDLKRLPKGTLLIAVNQHAIRLCKPNIIVFMDKPYENQEMGVVLPWAKERHVLLVSQLKEYSQIDIGPSYWDGGFSSSLATWLACELGCNPVLLCGMDCYKGEKKYFYDYKNNHPCVNYPLENHLAAWRPALEKCPHPERIKAMSGPLVEIFGEWNE
jgi:hypothetical protein